MDRIEQVTHHQASETARRVSAVVPAIAAAILGLFVIWGIGFAGPAVIHNAAHDSRHSMGFPCH